VPLQEAASLSLVAAVRLSKEEEVEAFAGIDAPVEEDMPLSSLHVRRMPGCGPFVLFCSSMLVFWRPYPEPD
jgi:hypothetical protein